MSNIHVLPLDLDIEFERISIIMVQSCDTFENLAPGSYHPEKVNLNKSPQYSFGVKTEIHETDSIPGIQALSNSFVIHFLSTRLLNRSTVSFKGPGEYSPEKAMLLLEKALRFTFGLRTSMNRPNDIPGKPIRNYIFLSMLL